jgi:hypothetical protein
MDEQFSGLSDFLNAEEQAGAVPDAKAATLDGLCAALSATGNANLPGGFSAQVAEGLFTLQEIARKCASSDLQAEEGSWSYGFHLAPLGASSLRLSRPDPEPVTLYVQLDREQRLHGLITLAAGSGNDEEVLSFGLEERPDGRYLRRQEMDRLILFRLEIPACQELPWAFTVVPEVRDEFLPKPASDGLGDLLQAVTNRQETEEPQTPPAPADATILADLAPAAPPVLCLVNEADGQVLPLKSRLTIGRSRECDLILNNIQVSRKHAVLEPAAGGWQIQDLNSTNGTWLNEQRISGMAALKAGDRLMIGSARFRVE